jgi:hypothetical protein
MGRDDHGHQVGNVESEVSAFFPIDDVETEEA